MVLRPRASILLFACLVSITLFLFYNAYFATVKQIHVVSVVQERHESEVEEKVQVAVPTKRVLKKRRKTTGSCHLPVLDPYHVDVMKYVEKLEKPACQGKNYGNFLKDGQFHVKAKNVRDATLRLIRRPPQNDFEVDTSKTIGIIDHPKTTLAKGRYGCLGIALNMNQIIAPKSQEDETTFAALKPQECTYEGILKFGRNGKIMHVESKRCLYVRDEKLRFKKCSKGWTKFDFDNHGRIWYDDSSLWGLWSKSYCVIAKRIDGRWKLKFSKVCKAGETTNTFYILEAKAKDVDMKIKIDEGAFQLHLMKDNQIHTEFHIHAPRIPEPAKFETKPAAIPLNIILLMFDSQSSANFERAMPKTMKTLRSLEHTFNFKGHTIVGDGTTAQLCAMLTGVAEENLPEARRDMDDSDFVDRWPFIFKVLSNHGYVTLFTDDQPSTASFNMRLHGFKDQPTDFYGRPFWLIAEKFHSDTYCIKNKFSHQYNFDYIKTLTQSYRDVKKFSLTITSDLCHNSVNPVQFADDDLTDFIQFLKVGGHLNDSMLIIFGDHGNRVSEFRETLQGKLEERLPFFAVTLPPWFSKAHPDYFDAMRMNTGMLTSHFDVYHTMMDVLGLYNIDNEQNVGQSLFRPIDNSTRSCASAGIDDHWCPCLVFTPMDAAGSEARELALKAVTFMNNLLASHPKAKKLCQPLELGKVIKAGKREPSSKVQKFANTRKNEKCDSCDIEYNEEPSHSSSTSYEILLEVRPSQGRFEVSMKEESGKITVDHRISRTNRYGKQPKCIEEEIPSLRQYCICKSFKLNHKTKIGVAHTKNR